MPTTQRLDGEDKDNQRTPQLLIIKTQEQTLIGKGFENKLENKLSSLELTKERFLFCEKCAKVLP